MVTIRPAVATDAEALAALSGQLGYPVEPVAMVQRLAAVANGDAGITLVAVDAQGAVCGMARALPQHFIAEAAFVELAALVVDAAARGTGVGKALLAAVEAWARERGFPGLCVRSSVVRTRAHHFYLREGYAESKRQAVFFKPL
ncbi:MAG TPA: GNAT family N-acetyltransferase [Rhodanobacteraceae bacterium]|jgi:GNAT superfamily N-acetyltransferase|nr:GNAT family N-acetyltransferase [Rhodanobacteraceae bacterium]